MIKKTICIALTCVCLSVLMNSCGSGVSGVVDPKVLENKEEVQKIYDAIMKSMGEQSSKAQEVTINIDNPADKGKKGDSYLHLMIDMQDPNKPKQLLRQQFHGELGYWMAVQEVTVQARGDVENYRLEDELFDFTKMDAEKLYNIIQKAYNKYADPAKYSYMYVSRVAVDFEEITVTVEGKLESNDQMITNIVKFDWDENIIR